MNTIVRLLVISVLLMAILISCSSNYDYQSRYYDKFTFVKEDSLSFQYTDSLIINRIQTVSSWGKYILVEDARSMRLWVFDRQLKFVTIIGTRGRGPGEYSHSCVPIPKGDSLLVLDYQLRKVNIYDTNFHYIGERTLPFEIAPNNTQFLPLNQQYILSGLYLGKAQAITFSKDYVRNNKSTFIFDSNFSYRKDLFPWDKLYENDEHSSFNSMASEVNFTSGHNNTFYAHQIGDYKMAHFDNNFQLLQIFGLKSSNAKAPPLNEVIVKQADSRSRASVLFTQSSINRATQYDALSNVILSYFENNTEESFYKRDPILSRHFLQMYDAKTYDCVFDGTIPGVLLFTENGRMYILTEDSSKQFTISIFKIQQKQQQ
jgi:hypothetical protein